MDYKILIIEEPYDFYEKCPTTRNHLSDIFKNQLRGYKNYYPNGVCPISEYDFFTNHIAIINKNDSSVLCSYKIMKYQTCLRLNKKFPLFCTLGESYPKHDAYVKEWLKLHPSTGYNHSWTINPDLKKEQKKELVDITFAILANFYKFHHIENMIDISIMPFKIHKIKEWMGNQYMNLDPFKVEAYGNLDGCLMTNEGLLFSKEFQDIINFYQPLWKNKTTINKQNFPGKFF